jgi:hypothetical protein
MKHFKKGGFAGCYRNFTTLMLMLMLMFHEKELSDQIFFTSLYDYYCSVRCLSLIDRIFLPSASITDSGAIIGTLSLSNRDSSQTQFAYLT